MKLRLLPPLLLCAVLTTGCGGSDGSGDSQKAETFNVYGTLTLQASFDGDMSSSSGVSNIDDVNCEGEGGFDDIREGAQVVVTDNSGKKLGIGSLEAGKLPEEESSPLDFSCEFGFTVTDVPEGKGPYSVEVSKRGDFAFTESEATNLQLSIGG